jgi:uncharacterized membrane protein
MIFNKLSLITDTMQNFLIFIISTYGFVTLLVNLRNLNRYLIDHEYLEFCLIGYILSIYDTYALIVNADLY